MKTLQIGNITLENNLILAPMAGAGSGADLYGNGKRKGHSLQK